MESALPLPQQSQERLRGIIDGYTADGAKGLPGVLYFATRKHGRPIFEHASGLRGINSPEPMSVDTVFWLASFTKLITSIACMQLVEQGSLNLDDADHVESLLPELRDIKVLKEAEGGNFELVEKKGRITLKMLLTHTAGFGYAFEDHRLAEFGRPIGFDDFSGDIEDVLNRPLSNQPGQKFQYGTSMDWVGILIERLTDLNLEDYFQRHILSPLGIRHISFSPSTEDKQQLAYLHHRHKDGAVIKIDHLYRRPLIRSDKSASRRYCAGGHGCFGRPKDFLKLIGLLLNDGKDEETGVRLLKPETVQEMCKDQIPDIPRDCNQYSPVAKPLLARPTPLAPCPDGQTEGWGFSFSISHFPEDTGRAAGAASWEGIANLFWFADRTNNIGGLIATQILPYGDPLVLECSTQVEAEIYRSLKDEAA